METTQELSTSLSKGFFQAFCPNPTLMYDLGEIYSELNAKFFNGELPVLTKVVKTGKDGISRATYPKLKWEGRFRKVLGMYHPGSELIRLSRAIAPDPVQVRSTLLHEMLHKYLDQKGLDDGILGHGENFISFAKRINDRCSDIGVSYRINFYDLEITTEQPTFQVDMLGSTEFKVTKDLDVVRKMKTVFKTSFKEYSYLQ